MADLRTLSENINISNVDNTSSTTFQVENTGNLIQDILYVIVTPLICAIGCVGNILSLCVLLRIRLGSSSRGELGKESTAMLGLVLLAASDLGFCVAVFPRALVSMTAVRALFVQKGFRLYYQVYGTGVVTTFILTSTWITVVLSLFRYIGICHPLRARRLIGPTGTVWSYLIVILLCVAVNLPSFWQYTIVSMVYEGTQYILIDIGEVDTRRSSGLAFIWIRTSFGVAIPAIILAFCNYSLTQTLRRSRRMRRLSHVSQDGGQKQSSFRINLTLFITVLMFILLVFPCEIMDFLHDIIHVQSEMIETFLVLRAVANVLQVINFSCNFLLYCAIGGQFREMMNEMVCKRAHRRNSISLSQGSRRRSSNYLSNYSVPQSRPTRAAMLLRSMSNKSADTDVQNCSCDKAL